MARVCPLAPSSGCLRWRVVRSILYYPAQAHIYRSTRPPDIRGDSAHVPAVACVSSSASRQVSQGRTAAIHALIHRVKALVATRHRRRRTLRLMFGARLVVAEALAPVEVRADRLLLHVERPCGTSWARGRLVVRIPEIHRFGGDRGNGRAGRRDCIISARRLFLWSAGGRKRRHVGGRGIRVMGRVLLVHVRSAGDSTPVLVRCARKTGAVHLSRRYGGPRHRRVRRPFVRSSSLGLGRSRSHLGGPGRATCGGAGALSLNGRDGGVTARGRYQVIETPSKPFARWHQRPLESVVRGGRVRIGVEKRGLRGRGSRSHRR